MTSHRANYCAGAKGLDPELEPNDLITLYASGGNGAWCCKYKDGRFLWKGLHETLIREFSIKVGTDNVKTVSLGKRERTAGL